MQKNESNAQLRAKTRLSPAQVPAMGQGTGSRAVLCRTRNRLETGRQIRVEWRNAGTAFAQPVLVQPGGVIPLNENAAALIELCDGTRSFDEVVEQFVAQPGNAGLTADAQDFLEAARQRGWIVEV